MPNKNYLKGRRKEYKWVNDLKDEGFIAQRSAGSHSPVDVFAIHPDKKIIRLIQCKPDTMPEKEQNKIKEQNKKLNGLFEVTFEVV